MINRYKFCFQILWRSLHKSLGSIRWQNLPIKGEQIMIRIRNLLLLLRIFFIHSNRSFSRFFLPFFFPIEQLNLDRWNILTTRMKKKNNYFQIMSRWISTICESGRVWTDEIKLIDWGIKTQGKSFTILHAPCHCHVNITCLLASVRNMWCSERISLIAVFSLDSCIDLHI